MILKVSTVGSGRNNNIPTNIQNLTGKETMVHDLLPVLYKAKALDL